MRVWIALLILLAGCSDAPSAFQDEQAATGSLTGIIVDPAIVPVTDARIATDAAATTSDENGVWHLKDLLPGIHMVDITKPGMVSMQVAAEVRAGEVTEVHVSMPYNATVAPFAVATQWKGFIDCSARIGDGAGMSIGINACNELAPTGLSQQAVNEVHDFDEGVPDAFQAELQWSQTQTSGSDLAMMVGPQGCTEPDYAWVSGASPIAYRLDRFQIGAHQVGPGNGLCTRVFTDTSSDLMDVAGVQVQQEFEGFSHAFYNAEPDPEWLFVRDGPPTV